MFPMQVQVNEFPFIWAGWIALGLTAVFFRSATLGAKLLYLVLLLLPLALWGWTLVLVVSVGPGDHWLLQRFVSDLLTGFSQGHRLSILWWMSNAAIAVSLLGALRILTRPGVRPGEAATTDAELSRHVE